MTLHPQVVEMMAARDAAGLPELWTLSPEEARAQMAAMAPQVEGEAVYHVEDRSIPGPAGEIPIRIYRPADGTLPAVVYFHGGGWVIGNLDSHDLVCRMLANRSGAVVISVDYRLAPEAKYPAAADDSYAATKWVAEHAAELDIDPNAIAVGGDSAGGNLAAVVSLMAKERGGPNIALQMLVYPVTDYSFDTVSYSDNGEGYFLSKDAMVWFWDHYLNDPSEGSQANASPLQAEDLSGLPPAWIITAEYDPLRDEGEAYAERLREAGVQVTVERYNGMIHGFFSMAWMLTEGERAVNEGSAALREVFGTSQAVAAD